MMKSTGSMFFIDNTVIQSFSVGSDHIVPYQCLLEICIVVIV